MNLSDLTSTGEKPWLTIVGQSIDCTLGTGVKTGIVNFENLPLALSPLPGNTILFTDSLDDGRPTVNNGTDVFKLAYTDEIPIASSLSSDIIFKQGAVSSGNVYGTWLEVADLIVAKEGLVNVYVDDSIVSPCVVSSNVDCKNRTQFYGSNNASSIPKLEISGGFALTDPKSFNTIEVQLSSPVLPNLVFTNGSIFLTINGATLKSIDSTVPNISFPDGSSMVLSFGSGGQIDNSGNIMLRLGIASQLILTILENAGNVVINNAIDSIDASSTIILGYDSTFDISNFTNPGFLGTLTLNPISVSQSVKYDDTLIPQLGSDNVQGALDGVKQRLTYNGFQAQYTGVGITLAPAGNSTSICDTLLLGSGYNVGTFTYTVPITGIYELSYTINWQWTSTVNPANARIDSAFRVDDGGVTFPGYLINRTYAAAGTAEPFNGINTITIQKQLNIGALVQISAANNSSANNMSITTNNTFFGARLLQAT